MNAQAIVNILLEGEEFDPRAYVMQSSLEGTAKRLGFEWLDWKVWYLEVGPWRVYVDPYSHRPLMEVEVAWSAHHDQWEIYKKVVCQQDAEEVLPAVLAVLRRHQNFEAPQVRDTRRIGDELTAALADFRPMESQEFDAREFFARTELPGASAARELGFEDDTTGDSKWGGRNWLKKIIGQWEIWMVPGEPESVVHAYRDYGWEKQMIGLFYVDNERVRECLERIMRVFEAHTDPQHEFATGHVRDVQLELERIKLELT